jgi:PPK2 family polyphosphate:nucleotide phosphotransferase
MRSLPVVPGSPADLAGRDPGDKLGLTDKADAHAAMTKLHHALSDLQARLFAEATQSLLVVLQAMDCGGKDGTIRSVFTGVNPQGVRVRSFSVPAGPEVAHDYLWRVHAACPSKGEIAIFNRSHYEDVLVVRVRGLVPDERWKKRYRHIRSFERMLAEEGTRIIKIFLHISADEQRERLQARLDYPHKNWKFRLVDLEDRKLWPSFMAAYEDAISETSTEWAPWYVVPATHKWVRNVAVSQLLVDTLKAMDPHYPPPPEDLHGITVS